MFDILQIGPKTQEKIVLVTLIYMRYGRLVSNNRFCRSDTDCPIAKFK